MIGISLGTLNTAFSYGKRIPGTTRLNCELLLSETSLRTSPSIISYTDSHRLVSESANLVIKKNLKSTFTNLSRLIGFIPNSTFCQKELNNFTLVGGEYIPQKNVFRITINSQQYELTPESIVLGYLNKIQQHYLKKNNIPCESFIFSVPDYFTCYQKDCFLNIISASCLSKNVHLINESTAITLYYGYKQYQEYFLVKNISDSDPTKKGVDPTVVKYVIFIDAGYSKTTFILSQLTHNLFKVLNTYVMPFFGGRNFDDAILNFCINKYKSQTGDDLSKNNKVKLRMLERISKVRKALTVNTEMAISFDSLTDDQDFNYVLTRNEYESIINDLLEEFQEGFITFYNQCSTAFPNAMLNTIEMAGELMRTPSLQKRVKAVTGIEMSKRILTDECIAIGCSLYGSIMAGSFPIPNFQGIFHFNKYSIGAIFNGEDLGIIVGQSEIPIIRTINVPQIALQRNAKLTFEFYYVEKEVNYYYPATSYTLQKYEMLSKAMYEQAPYLTEAQCNFLIDNNGYVHINQIKLINKDGSTQDLKYKPGIISAYNNGIYKSKEEMKKTSDLLLSIENSFIKVDEQYQQYFTSKNALESRLYEIKNKVNNKNLGNSNFQGKQLSTILEDIENLISGDNVIDLTNIQNQLQLISKTFSV